MELPSPDSSRSYEDVSSVSVFEAAVRSLIHGMTLVREDLPVAQGTLGVRHQVLGGRASDAGACGM